MAHRPLAFKRTTEGSYSFAHAEKSVSEIDLKNGLVNCMTQRKREAFICEQSWKGVALLKSIPLVLFAAS